MTVYDFARACMNDPEFNRGGIVKDERAHIKAVGFQGGADDYDLYKFYESMAILYKLQRKYSKAEVIE